jgi:outer membrane protein assembly factor BamE
MRKTVFIFSLSFLLSGCSWSNFPFLYKPDIQQGNVMPPERVAAVKPGMSENEVIYLLGNPVLENTFANEDTVYVYTFKPGKGTMSEQTLLLTFHNNHLVQKQTG